MSFKLLNTITQASVHRFTEHNQYTKCASQLLEIKGGKHFLMRTNEATFLLRCNKSAKCNGRLPENPINKAESQATSPMLSCK